MMTMHFTFTTRDWAWWNLFYVCTGIAATAPHADLKTTVLVFFLIGGLQLYATWGCRTIGNVIIGAVLLSEVTQFLILGSGRLHYLFAALLPSVAAAFLLTRKLHPHRSERRHTLLTFTAMLRVSAVLFLIPACILLYADSAEGNLSITGKEVPVSSALTEEEEAYYDLTFRQATQCLENWSQLSSDQRQACILQVAELECSRYGLSRQPEVKFVSIEQPEDRKYYHAGLFDHDTGTVYLDEDLLLRESGEDAVRALCHELTHAYQGELIRVYHTMDDSARQLLIFSNIAQMEYEITYYRSGSEDFSAYESQLIESMARDYAEVSVHLYCG